MYNNGKWTKIIFFYVITTNLYSEQLKHFGAEAELYYYYFCCRLSHTIFLFSQYLYNFLVCQKYFTYFFFLILYYP